MSLVVLQRNSNSSGLEFRKYISIQRGMTEGELLSIAGVPDLRSRDHFFSSDAYTYMPTSTNYKVAG